MFVWSVIPVIVTFRIIARFVRLVASLILARGRRLLLVGLQWHVSLRLGRRIWLIMLLFVWRSDVHIFFIVATILIIALSVEKISVSIVKAAIRVVVEAHIIHVPFVLAVIELLFLLVTLIVRVIAFVFVVTIMLFRFGRVVVVLLSILFFISLVFVIFLR